MQSHHKLDDECWRLFSKLKLFLVWPEIKFSLSVGTALFTNDNVKAYSHQAKAKAKIVFAISLILFYLFLIPKLAMLTLTL